ncbi:P-loop NTPase [Clavibacter zhangzhiyongii]|uniref:nucleotide-binding protein n=1 Tax=Clavibacter zhangzhiyongii TaxID=2768071 RepID=UPI0039E00BF8
MIQEAPEPLSPSAPNGRTNTLAGLLLGLLAGLLGIVLVRLLDTRVRSAETVAHLTTAPLLGALERERGVTGLAMALRPLSTAAEGFRQLKANLRFVLLGDSSSAIVVTSSIPGEGKSTVAANLAISLSEGGRRVLLVDADLRRPRGRAVPRPRGRRGPHDRARRAGPARGRRAAVGRRHAARAHVR